MNNTLDGHAFHIEERTEYRTAFVTAPEIGHQMNTTIQITRNGVTALIATPANPDVDFIDHLLADAIRDKPVAQYMSAASSSFLKSILAHKGPYDDFAPLGELNGAESILTKNGTWVCFDTDTFGGLHFLVERRSGQRFVRKISEKLNSSEHSCGLSVP